jgi:hypothetical protein
MPKPGMTSICLKQEVADLVRKRSQDAGQGLNDYLSSLLLGPSLQHREDRPGTVPNHQGLETTRLLEILLNFTQTFSQNNQKQAPFTKSSKMVGLPGFGPGSFPHTAHGDGLREPKSPSLDHASRQPHIIHALLCLECVRIDKI